MGQSLPSAPLPLVQELRPAPDPEEIFLALSDKPYCLFLDSARPGDRLGRYSFVMADPVAFFRWPVGGLEVLRVLRERLAQHASEIVPDLPPFQGGLAGVFSYDFSRSLEKVPAPRFDEFQLPAVAVGLYDFVVAFDHLQRAAWLVSQGLPETEPDTRLRRARQRLQQVLDWLSHHPANLPAGVPSRSSSSIDPAQLAPQYPTAAGSRLTSNFTPAGYRAAVQRAVDYIHAGDVFQVNLSQRLLHPADEASVMLYQRLRRRNAAPFAAYFDVGDYQVLSASPERFMSVRDRVVEARPIKGTRRRSAHPEADLFAGDELLESEKDRAENVMIVDLLRNDMSRVCHPESVHVTQLCGLEIYQYVQHLVSVIRGQLAPGRAPLDLIEAAFPGGSVTGAPKVRAMEIIAELEPTARGPYCGCLGYIGLDGCMDMNILIRTITAGRGWWQLPVGGGVVAQSTPQREYEETWHKAEGLLRALT